MRNEFTSRDFNLLGICECQV